MIQRKRILFIMPALLGGGAEKVLIDILKNFDFTKYDVSLLLEYREGVYLEQVPAEVNIISLYPKDNLWFQRIKRYSHIFHCFWLAHPVLFWYILRKKLRTSHFDTVVSFMEGEAVKLHSYIFDKGNQNVSWVHINLEAKHWSLESFANSKEEEGAYSRMDRIIAVSEDAKDAFCNIFPDIHSKVSVIYNLIDRQQIKDKAALGEGVIEENCPVICAVGRLNPQKRYDRALEAIKLLNDRDIKCVFWILGDGELTASLKELASSLGIEKQVRFLGFHNNPYPYISACDIFLNSSDSEGYPLTICEALCLGKAIVATDITGSHEILQAANSGILVSQDSLAIADAIEKFLADSELKSKAEQNAQRGSETFDINKTMDLIYSVL